MQYLLSTLSAGLRRLEPDGRLKPEAASAEDLHGVASLFVVDLEMSGPNAQMHEVLDVGGVRAELARGIPEEEAWGTRVKPLHIGNAVPGALKVVGYSAKNWKAALKLEEAFDRFARLGRDAVIAGWGIGQDMAFLAETFRRLDQPWPFALVALDVQPIARGLVARRRQDDRFTWGTSPTGSGSGGWANMARWPTPMPPTTCW